MKQRNSCGKSTTGENNPLPALAAGDGSAMFRGNTTRLKRTWNTGMRRGDGSSQIAIVLAEDQGA
jgi:hypothetical protein